MDGQYWKGDRTISTNEWLLTSDFWQFLEPWHGRWYEYEIFIASCTDNIYDLENERWLLRDMIDHVGIYGSSVAEGLSEFNVGLVNSNDNLTPGSSEVTLPKYHHRRKAVNFKSQQNINMHNCWVVLYDNVWRHLRLFSSSEITDTIMESMQPLLGSHLGKQAANHMCFCANEWHNSPSNYYSCLWEKYNWARIDDRYFNMPHYKISEMVRTMHYWKPRFAMMPTLLLVVASKVLVMKTFGSSNDD